MRARLLTSAWISVLVVALLAQATAFQADAAPPGNTYFERTWARTDEPVASSASARTWMWGPEAFTPPGLERYTESPNALRAVQYFDKSRMEITDPSADAASPWYVTNGLLVVAMVTGMRQMGDADLYPHPDGPAAINVAGDPDDPTGPTYATFTDLSFPGYTVGSAIGAHARLRVDRAGTVHDDPSLVNRAVFVVYYDPVTRHNIAGPFWTFMNSRGLVYEDGRHVEDSLFPNPFYATGRPITEPYWANVKVAGSYRDVLLQCFERRCLTYTPENPVGWQVEAGNVGRHYYEWNYGATGDSPPNWGLQVYSAQTSAWGEWPRGAFDPSEELWLGGPAGNAGEFIGRYRLMTGSEPGSWIAARGDLPAFGDIAVHGQVQLVASVHPGDRGCVLSRVVEQGANLQLYALCLRAGGDLLAFYYEQADGVVHADWFISPGEYPSPWPADVQNDLVIVARGHDLWFQLNDASFGPFRHTRGPLEGAIGLAVQRGAGGSGVATIVAANLGVFMLR